jgi:hypothetical protein
MASRTPSSLGPSDSASQQQTSLDIAMDTAIDAHLERVEPLSVRPRFLPTTVLWYFGDCAQDTSQGEIVTTQNPNRPKMGRAIRRADGTPISGPEYSNIRRSADILAQDLTRLINSDPRSATYVGEPKKRIRTLIKTVFMAEYKRAMLKLEAEHKLLRLCSSHWKADHMIGQAFSRRKDAERVMTTRVGSEPSNVEDSRPPKPSTLIPQALGATPKKVAKRVFELSPGPKSPSASHAQKRSKDIIVSGQKTTSAGPPDSEYLTR